MQFEAKIFRQSCIIAAYRFFFCLRKKFPGAFHDISIDRPKAISAFNDLKDKKTFQRRTFRLYYDFTRRRFKQGNSGCSMILQVNMLQTFV
jgi:hypothetical protein